MCKPHFRCLGVATSVKTAGETDLRRIAINIRKPVKGERTKFAPGKFAHELWLQVGLSRFFGTRWLPIWRTPLHNIVVLRSFDRQTVEVLFANKRPNIGDMAGRNSWRDLNHHTPTGDLNVDYVLWVGCTPRVGWSRRDNVRVTLEGFRGRSS